MTEFISRVRGAADWLRSHLVSGPFIFFGERLWAFGFDTDEAKPPTNENDNDKDAA